MGRKDLAHAHAHGQGCNDASGRVVDSTVFAQNGEYHQCEQITGINGHEYAKRQLAIEGIEFEALDNGILSCADPTRLQQILNDLNEEKMVHPIKAYLD